MKPAKKTKPLRKSRSSAGINGTRQGFTPEEQAAMRERLREARGSARRGSAASKTEGEDAVLAKLAELPAPDRAIGERIHALIKANAPTLSPRTWYGMPAYAKDGHVLCFFQSAQKFKTRYATLGFSDKAKLDDGNMWPTAFALKSLTDAEATQIAALLKKATS